MILPVRVGVAVKTRRLGGAVLGGGVGGCGGGEFIKPPPLIVSELKVSVLLFVWEGLLRVIDPVPWFRTRVVKVSLVPPAWEMSSMLPPAARITFRAVPPLVRFETFVVELSRRRVPP